MSCLYNLQGIFFFKENPDWKKTILRDDVLVFELKEIMAANPNLKTKGNVPGRYYVDQECIACDACILVADKHFKMNTEKDPAFAFVCKQPQTPQEEELCEEAMESCPVEAIGNDGKDL